MAYKSLRSVASGDDEAGYQARSVGKLGHLRMGEMVPVGGGKSRPTVADAWIVTTQDREIANVVAEHFGATVATFSGNGKSADKWEVRTAVTSLPVRLGPDLNPDRMAGHELFGGKGLVRRCSWDRTSNKRVCGTSVESPAGLIEVLGECVCAASIAATGRAPSDGMCKPTLRLDVFLDVPTIPVVGTFGFVSHSEMACDEMPTVAGLLHAMAVRSLMVPAHLVIDRRSSRGGTKQFAVPVLRIVMPQSELLALSSVHTPVALDLPDSAGELPASTVETVPPDVVAAWRETFAGLIGPQRERAMDGLRELGVSLKHDVPADARPAIETLVAAVTADDIDDAEIVYEDGEEPFV